MSAPSPSPEYVRLRAAVAQELLHFFGMSIQDFQADCAEQIMQRLQAEGGLIVGSGCA